MKKLIVILLSIFIIISLTGCGGSGSPELKLTASAANFEKSDYTAKAGSKNKIVMNAPDLIAIEIKGLGLKLDKKQLSKEVTFINAGIYDIIGNLGNGKLIKSKLTIQ